MNPITELRRTLHQHPDLSGEEFQTRQGVREFFSLLPGFALGTVVVKEGTFTAAVKSLAYHLNGKTAHAGEPEQGRNPA
jgi:metal-dependent amidase/aminoacylase/carboxypeptidase family protein